MKKKLLSLVLSVAVILTVLSGCGSKISKVTTQANVLPVLSGFSTKVFTKGTSSVSKPDDIATMGGNIFVGNQNGVGSDGAASSTNVLNSNILEYDPAGK